MPNGYISSKEAAEIAGVTTGYIRRLLLQGRLKGKKIGRDWRVNKKSIQEFVNSPRKTGRPPIDKRKR
jgi:excisionase family DNA binding protein